ncbi:hypothetical protein FKM82_012961 [Ascaphus truei]
MAILRDAVQHGGRAAKPGGGPGGEVHGAGVHQCPEPAAAQPDRGGGPDHAEHAAAAAQGDRVRAGGHQTSHQGQENNHRVSRAHTQHDAPVVEIWSPRG